MSGDQRQPSQQDRQHARDAFDDALADIFSDDDGEPSTAAPPTRPQDAAEQPAATVPRRERPVPMDPDSPFAPARQRSLFRMMFIGCLLMLALPFACGVFLTILGLLFPDSGSASSAPGILLPALLFPIRVQMEITDTSRRETGE